MEKTKSDICKELDDLLEGAKTIDDLNNIHFIIEDYIENGYNIKDYVYKYNTLVQKFYPQ
jgi:hypothetical protein